MKRNSSCHCGQRVCTLPCGFLAFEHCVEDLAELAILQRVNCLGTAVVFTDKRHPMHPLVRLNIDSPCAQPPIEEEPIDEVPIWEPEKPPQMLFTPRHGDAF